jgi:hypothetical protein
MNASTGSCKSRFARARPPRKSSHGLERKQRHPARGLEITSRHHQLLDSLNTCHGPSVGARLRGSRTMRSITRTRMATQACPLHLCWRPAIGGLIRQKCISDSDPPYARGLRGGLDGHSRVLGGTAALRRVRRQRARPRQWGPTRWAGNAGWGHRSGQRGRRDVAENRRARHSDVSALGP